MTLQLYVLRLVALRTLAAAVILAAILQILDLLDVTADILERDLGLEGVVRYALLRLPALIRQAAPLAMLVGAIFAFAQLARDNAVVAMRAAGVSLYRLVLMTVPAAIGVALVSFAVIELVGPSAQSSLDVWWAETAPSEDRDAPTVLSFRSGGYLVLARPGGSDGNRLEGLSIYRRNGEGLLIERITADTATFADGVWTLADARSTQVAEAGAATADVQRMTWPIPLLPTDVQALSASDEAVSPAAARRALAGGGADESLAFYRTQLQRGLAEPLGALVMLLLAAPVATANFRNSRAAELLVGSLAAGLTFLIVDGVLTALGQTGALPGVVAAWTAPLIFAGAGATALLYLEG